MTVTLADLLPLFDVNVTVATPTDTPVTLPFVHETIPKDGSIVQTPDLSLASSGKIIGSNTIDIPLAIVSVSFTKLTEVTSGFHKLYMALYASCSSGCRSTCSEKYANNKSFS